ncbi:hypothetical protein HS088_TW15G00578 [Tripterygium wilfordii]|uniref:protein-tyrosine-phosphatase n=1 Tax=Tripterygium wilfordii TaxID=458696 RepID=A0A7J7CM18_TRIWF|nr:hypothetical protein HS088_TW15G00578 [Tripterygium wilfordii]
MFDQQMLNQWEELYDSTDEYTDKWLSSAQAFLEQFLDGRDVFNPFLVSSSGSEKEKHNDTQFQHINVLVTSGSLIPSLTKCLLFQLNNVITHGNVYSSWEVGKLKCFQIIKERFSSPNVRFCVIGDGWEE